jgi:hypothetical protein
MLSSVRQNRVPLTQAAQTARLVQLLTDERVLESRQQAVSE